MIVTHLCVSALYVRKVSPNVLDLVYVTVLDSLGNIFVDNLVTQSLSAINV